MVDAWTSKSEGSNFLRDFEVIKGKYVHKNALELNVKKM